jgi:Baseplate J-like protein
VNGSRISPHPAPLLDGRDADAVVAELRARLPAYLPGWSVESRGPAAALLQVFGRYVQALIERLNQAPAKNELAFLDLLGINLLPAQAARAPVVFQPMPNAGDGRAPAATQVGAKVEGRDGPLVFETERPIAIVTARLAEVVTLWPGKDAYADHSAAALGGQPFTLFEQLQPIPHELYLAHDVHFALSGPSTVNVQFELSSPASRPLELEWEYWDGEVWRAFKGFKEPDQATDRDSLDGTDGLTRSGVVRLVADCAEAKTTRVAGISSHWIRARTIEPLPADPALRLPRVDRIRIGTVIAPQIGTLDFSTDGLGDPGRLVVSLSQLADRGIEVRGALVTLEAPDGTRLEQVILTDRVQWEGRPPGAHRVRVSVPGFPLFDESIDPGDNGIICLLHPTIEGLEPDAAYADGLKLDVSKTFFPMGQSPQPGTSFFLSCEEALAKPGAVISLFPSIAKTGRTCPDDGEALDLSLEAEYWNGSAWRPLRRGGQLPSEEQLEEFFSDGVTLTFDVPEDVVSTEVGGSEARWIRIRIREGSFGCTRTLTWQDAAENVNTIVLTETYPPALATLRIGYVYRSPLEPPRACVVRNEFSFEDHTAEARWRGGSFEPFSVVTDRTPALYLGFDRPLPADLVALFLHIEEVVGETDGPLLRWEHWDEVAWSAVTVRDETRNLALPGAIEVLWPGSPPPVSALVAAASGAALELADPQQAPRFRPGDLIEVSEDGKSELATVAAAGQGALTLTAPLERALSRGTATVAALPRFGTPRTWLRARLQSDGPPRKAVLRGIHLNAVWASQVQTFADERLGSSTGQESQSYFFRNRPVLSGEVVEVRELDGARAHVELPILREELLREGFTDSDLRTVTDPRTGRVTEAWVRWRERPNLAFSGPGDRHHTMERSRGRLSFGDGRHGRIPPAGTDNIRARSYRSGGGAIGNVPAGDLSQLLSGVLAASVTNPRAAEGGADGEPPETVLIRGPKTVGHRREAISLEDYEGLAREASPAVAVARALPATDPTGRPAPGWVKVIVMPQSGDPRPAPSFELRRQVREFLSARLPASMAGQVSVAAPDYQPIGVSAVVVAEDPGVAGPVVGAAEAAIRAFLHPLTGGPEGQGWPFGRDVFISDVARVLESVPGVDFVPTLELLLDGTPRGERVDVPPDRIVVAGPIRILAAGEEG